VTLDHLDTPGKQEIVHARYVVGCDGKISVVLRVAQNIKVFAGAHSWVRKTLDITMDGEQTG